MTVSPAVFKEDHVADTRTLLSAVDRSSVSLRGWEFPVVSDPEKALSLTQNDVSYAIDWDFHREVWKAQRSGQFVYIGGFWNDWRDRSTNWPAEPGWRWDEFLQVADVVFRFVEALEFAARYSMTEAGADPVRVRIRLHNLSGRRLHLYTPGKAPLIRRYEASLSEFVWHKAIPRAELVAQTRELALEGPSELFERCGWTPGPSILRSVQDELGD